MSEPTDAPRPPVAPDLFGRADALTVSFLRAATWLPLESSDPEHPARATRTIGVAAEQCGQ